MSELHTGGEPLDAYRARLDGATIAMYAAAMFIVPAKISCRISVGGWSNVRLDDYLSVITLVLANGFFWITNQGTFTFVFKPAISRRTCRCFFVNHLKLTTFVQVFDNG